MNLDWQNHAWIVCISGKDFAREQSRGFSAVITLKDTYVTSFVNVGETE